MTETIWTRSMKLNKLMLNNIRINPPNLIEKFRGGFYSDFTYVQYIFHLRHDTRLFACPLPLWPERVMACRVSLPSVSLECVELLLVESGFQDLLFVTITLGFTRFFLTNTLYRLI